ncbi:hypothetical protein Acsp06_19230 [Actinomycetospora sp. NBRC 106375]|uniref:SRPBCC family protein n=1 Tax=Actinomycetospora sp. NBRC 106375 TaxID=3032207 RepID=UPI0024A09FFB|nr:SRPBCC domain-containing protein [Actinomycetospora sp. NBRC 106375]GLZ45738.1 hypothetical protein Acsp06_19230 [Actinomycetospora sp. NBRC 106375]
MTGTALPRFVDYASSLTFAGPPEKVVEALTDPAGLTAWWTPTSGSGAEGGQLRLDFGWDQPLLLGVHTARPILVVWDVLVCTFLPDWEGTSIVFDIGIGNHGACDMFFRHHGLNVGLDCYETCHQGWAHFLGSLKAYVDTGVGNPRGSAADQARRR